MIYGESLTAPEIELMSSPEESKNYPTLVQSDLANVVNRLPRDVRQQIKQSKGRLFLAGGYIRDRVTGDKPSDIDLFCMSKDEANAFSGKLADCRGVRTVTTVNAITVVSPFSVQYIHRWTSLTPWECAESFDFTVTQAVVWYDHTTETWCSRCHPDFYVDLAARRLIYTHPNRNEDAGGSMLRVLKFTRRGYYCPPNSLAGVVARLLGGLNEEALNKNKHSGSLEEARTMVIAGLLRDVDPLIDPEGLVH